MKTIIGEPYNIQGEIVARLTTKPIPVFKRKNYVLFATDTIKAGRGYLAVISKSKTASGKRAMVYSIPNDSSANDGDVVLITPEGRITFLYEVNSAHNAIMATERCNHRCIMCPQPPVTQEKDKTEFNLRLIELFDKKTKEVGITGGEPTLIEDNLFVLIKRIQKKLPNSAISILSNGVKFSDKEYAKKLALCRHKDLQIDIPLFSDIADEHNAIVGAKTFYKTVGGLYNLATFRQRIGIRVVIHKKTYRRLVHLADFIYHNFPFVSHVAFMQMETIGLAENHIDELWIDPFDYNNELREAVLLLHERGISTYIYNAQLCVLPDEIKGFAVQSISDWKDIYLPECDLCILKGKCGGFFESNRAYHSSHIAPCLIDYHE